MNPVDSWSKFGRSLMATGVDWGLFTVLDVDWTEGLVRRSFSSDEARYPSGGVKRLMGSAWAKQVLYEGRPFISEDVATFRGAFFDHELLESMGLHFALNVPILDGGKTVRTLNLLRANPVFSKDELGKVRATAAVGLEYLD